MIEPKVERVAIIIVVGALVIGNVFFGFNYFANSKELKTLQSGQSKAELNTKVLNFTEMFIKEVLQANTEVNFETRLSLENAVRDLKDEEVMAEWQNFTGAKTEIEAQNSVKKLLGILVNKIQR